MRLSGVGLLGRRGVFSVEFGGGRLLRVEPTAANAPKNGFLLLPGLIDAHVHLAFLPPSAGAQFLTAGVMAVRDLGGECRRVTAWRVAAQTPLRVLAHGPPLDGVPPEPRALAFGARGIRSRQEVDAHLDELALDGAAGLKLYFGFPVDLLSYAVSGAHARGLRVAAHLGSGTMPKFNSISPAAFGRAGGDTVEHVHSFTREVLTSDQLAEMTRVENLPPLSRVFLAWSRCDPDAPHVREAIDRFVATGAALVPTLSILAQMSRAIMLPGADNSAWRPNIEDARFAYVREGFERMLAFVARFHDRGGRLVAGTDFAATQEGILPEQALALELRLMRRAGLSAGRLLLIATECAASALKVPIGRIERGLAADMILARAVDAEDFLNTWRVEAVIQNDVVIHGAIPADVLEEKPMNGPEGSVVLTPCPRVKFRTANGIIEGVASRLREFAGRLAFGPTTKSFPCTLLFATPDTLDPMMAAASEAVLPILAVGPYLVIGPVQTGSDCDVCSGCFFYAAFGRSAREMDARLHGELEANMPHSERLYRLLAASLRAAGGNDRPVYIFDTRTGKRRFFRWEHANPCCATHARAASAGVGSDVIEGPLEDIRGPKAETKFPWRSFVDARCGIVRRIERLPVSLANPVDPSGAALSLFAGWRARPLVRGVEVCMGVDVDSRKARIKAAMEGIERWCIEAAARRAVWEGRHEDVPDAVNPRNLHLYTEEQYASPAFPYRQWMPETRIWWTEGYDALKGRPSWIPLELVSSVWPDGAPTPLCQLTSIGCAARRSYSAAALGAVLELVERDAVMRWWYRLTQPRAVWKSMLPDQLAHSTLPGGSSAITVMEIGWLPEVSVCLAAITVDGRDSPRLSLGAAASLQEGEAIQRACCEAAVNFLGFSRQHGAPPTLRRHMEPREHGEYYARDAFASHLVGELIPTAGAPLPKGATEVPDCSPQVGLSTVFRALEAQQFQAVLVDLTPASMRRRNVAVIRAVIPQLLPMSFGLGQDRWARVVSRIDPAWRERIQGVVHPFP